VKFKKFIHVYSGVHEALQQCMKALEKLIHSEECTDVVPVTLCRYYADVISALQGSLRSDVVSEMREMKTAAKDKLSRIEQETKHQAKEIAGMISELERFSSVFDKVRRNQSPCMPKQLIHRKVPHLVQSGARLSMIRINSSVVYKRLSLIGTK
jgi:CII-binding regulator of phage lambda lysogenization HflD